MVGIFWNMRANYGISSGSVWAFPDLSSISGLLKIRETSGP